MLALSSESCRRLDCVLAERRPLGKGAGAVAGGGARVIAEDSDPVSGARGTASSMRARFGGGGSSPLSAPSSSSVPVMPSSSSISRTAWTRAGSSRAAIPFSPSSTRRACSATLAVGFGSSVAQLNSPNRQERVLRTAKHLSTHRTLRISSLSRLWCIIASLANCALSSETYVTNATPRPCKTRTVPRRLKSEGRACEADKT